MRRRRRHRDRRHQRRLRGSRPCRRRRPSGSSTCVPERPAPTRMRCSSPSKSIVIVGQSARRGAGSVRASPPPLLSRRRTSAAASAPTAPPPPAASAATPSSSLSGRNGDGSVLAQHRRVETERFRVVVVRHVQPLRLETEVGRREEPEILAARVPRRRDGVGETVGHLLRRRPSRRSRPRSRDRASSDASRTRSTFRRATTPDSSCASAPSTDRCPTTFACPVATSTTHSLRFVSWNMIRLPSGDHAAV